MARHKKKGARTPDTGFPAPSPTPPGKRRFGEPEVLGILAAVVCGVLAWFSRASLNSDGVSYLDLARLLRIGDWDGFVQGYWSPLYPAIVATLSLFSGGAPLALVMLAHLVNGLVAMAGIALLWHWGRRTARPFVARALLAAFLLASTGLPRIEAVTPDVLLQGLMAWIGYELVFHRDRRPVPSGIALGLAFLAKTSVWPWLLLSLPLRLWSASVHGGRQRVLVSSTVALVVASTWIIPMSFKAGHLTAGSAGRLNYGWYIGSSNARTPDTHIGRHQAYQTVVVDSAHQVDVADFVAADRWTYAPWSDPTAWDAGIESANTSRPAVGELLAYWGRQTRRTFGFWMLPVILGVLLPAALVYWRPGLASHFVREDRSALVAFLLGLAGVLQFVLVHSEPRLIAPFVLLLALALLHPLIAETRPEDLTRRIQRQIGTALGWLCVIWLSIARLNTWVLANEHTQEALANINAGAAALDAVRRAPLRIVVAGPAMPVAPAAFMAGAHIVAQLPPRSLVVAQSLPPDRQLSLLTELFAGKAEVAWITDWNGAVVRVPIPPR